jgi:cytochrome c oxidase cbb3-type subunit 3
MPAIGSADFLAVADDDFIRATITHGRPGRKMPAWGTKDGGLDREEINRIVSHLRSLAPGTPEPWTATLPPGDSKRGADLYQRNCGGCHGAKGEGVSAPELRNPAFLAAASDTFIARTILRGRRGSGMRHFGAASTSFDVLELADVADVVAFIRSFSEKKE